MMAFIKIFKIWQRRTDWEKLCDSMKDAYEYYVDPEGYKKKEEERKKKLVNFVGSIAIANATLGSSHFNSLGRW